MDKELYWKNRKLGKRGQGEPVDTMKQIKEVAPSLRARLRGKAPSDPKYTKKRLGDR